MSHRSLHSFDVQNARHSLDRTNHPIQVFHIKHFDGHFYVTSLVVNRGTCVANTCLHVRNRAGDPGNHSGPILSDCQQLHCVCCLLRTSRPLYFNDTFAIDHQLVDVLTTLRVYGDTFSTSDVTNDVLTVQRITTASARHHQIVNATDDDRIVAKPNESLDRTHSAS